MSHQKEPTDHYRLEEVTAENIQQFRRTGKMIKAWGSDTVPNGKKALFQLALILLHGGRDEWPTIITEEEMFFALRHSFELWECLE